MEPTYRNAALVLAVFLLAGCQESPGDGANGIAGSLLGKVSTAIGNLFSKDRDRPMAALAAVVTRNVPPRQAGRKRPSPILVRVSTPAQPTLDQVIAAMRGVPASKGIREMARRGFVRLGMAELRRLISGNTLNFMNSYSYYSKDSKIRLKETLLGGGLESTGTWSIKVSNLCHSVREGHEFCTGLFFREAELLCWPGIGWSPDDSDYLRRCAILAGNQTQKAPGAMAAIVTRKVPPRPTVDKPAPPAPTSTAPARLSATPPVQLAPPTLDQVIAAMRGVPASKGIREMAKRGFVRLRGEALKKRITGSTLKMVNSFSYYEGNQRIRIREISLGGGLKSAGTWYIKKSNLCHSVREDHEFCSGLFFRGADLLCWPGIDWSPNDVDYLRTCLILAGDKAG